MDELVDNKLAYERESQKKVLHEMYDKKLEYNLAHENESQKKVFKEMYYKKLEDALVQKLEMRKKDLEELHVVCENNILYVASMLWSYNMIYALCVDALFMMKKLAPTGITIQPSTKEDGELPKKVVLGGASRK